MKNRVREINAAFRKYGFGKLLTRTLKEKILPSKDEEYNILLDPDLPVNLRLMFQELGTSFIKLGQLLSTRPDMVGERIATEFEKKHYGNAISRLPAAFQWRFFQFWKRRSGRFPAPQPPLFGHTVVFHQAHSASSRSDVLSGRDKC